MKKREKHAHTWEQREQIQERERKRKRRHASLNYKQEYTFPPTSFANDLSMCCECTFHEQQRQRRFSLCRLSLSLRVYRAQLLKYKFMVQ